MDAAMMKRAVDRFLEDLEQVWLDGYKEGVDSMRHAMGQPRKYTGKPSTPGSEVPPAFIDDE